MLCAASEIFRILAYSALCLLGVWWHIQSYSVLLRHFYAYWDIIKAYLLIQGYSAPCVTLAYSQPCHILSLGIFITRGLFETLRNVDQAYAEPRYRALFSHIQAYSEPSATLANAETWYTRNPGIFRTLPAHIQNSVILPKIYEYSKLWHI